MRLLILCLLLSACVSPEERARRQDAQEIPECTRLGFKEKTETFAQCRLQLRSNAAQEQNAKANAYNASMQNYWNTYRATTQPYGR